MTSSVSFWPENGKDSGNLCRQDCFVPSATWVCSDDARTRAEGIFEVSIRRDSVYALVLVSHCVILFVFDMKLARDDSVVIVVSSLMALMTEQVPNVRVKAVIKSSWFVVW